MLLFCLFCLQVVPSWCGFFKMDFKGSDLVERGSDVPSCPPPPPLLEDLKEPLDLVECREEEEEDWNGALVELSGGEWDVIQRVGDCIEDGRSMTSTAVKDEVVFLARERSGDMSCEESPVT